MKLEKKHLVTTLAIGLTTITLSTLAQAGSAGLWNTLSKKPTLSAKSSAPITARDFVGIADGYQVYRELSTSNLKTAKLIFLSKDGTSAETTIDASTTLSIKDGSVIGSILGTDQSLVFSSKDGAIVSEKMGGGSTPTSPINDFEDELAAGGSTPTRTNDGGGSTPTRSGDFDLSAGGSTPTLTLTNDAGGSTPTRTAPNAGGGSTPTRSVK